MLVYLACISTNTKFTVCVFVVEGICTYSVCFCTCVGVYVCVCMFLGECMCVCNTCCFFLTEYLKMLHTYSMFVCVYLCMCVCECSLCVLTLNVFIFSVCNADRKSVV